jgi:hypothetical protein
MSIALIAGQFADVTFYLHSSGKSGKAHKKKLKLAELLDNPLNALYGIVIALWVSVVIERWRAIQETLIHEWDMDALDDILKSDERPEFNFQFEYNPIINLPVKVGIGKKWFFGYLHLFVFASFVTGTCLTIYYFEKLTSDTYKTVSTSAIWSEIT